MSALPEAVQGILVLVTLMVFGSAAGYGLLSLARFPADRRCRLLLAPIAVTILWALSGDLLVRLGWTMAQLTGPLWGVSILLALTGACYMLADRASALDGRTVLATIGAAAITVLVMGRPIARGLFAHMGPLNTDTFLYSALAAAYWDRGLGSDGPFAVFYQQLDHYLLLLGAARNHTFVLLDFLSPLIEAGEPIFVRNLFECWMVFVATTAAAYYLLVSRPSPATPMGRTLAYMGLFMGLGWAFVPAAVGNWDNALFVGLVPVLAGLSYEPARARTAVALGVVLAYAFLTYPELCPIAAVVAAPFFVLRLRHGTALRGRLVLVYLGALLVAGILILPAARAIWDYVFFQLSTAVSSNRPGGAFSIGLLDRWWHPGSWWAMGPDQHAPAGWSGAALAALLTLGTAVGFIRAWRQPRRPEPWAGTVLLAAVLYFLVREQYAYGVYKILSVSWWLVALLTLDGVEALGRRLLPRAELRWRRALAGSAVAVIVVASLAAVMRNWEYRFPPSLDGILPSPDQLVELRDRARRQPAGDVLITGQLATAPALPWVWYVLRSTPLRVFVPTTPLPPLPAVLAWTGAASPPVTLRASNERQADDALLFETPRFVLLELKDRAWLSGMESPNGVETWGTWLGTQDITIDIKAESATVVTIGFNADPGPSRPESPERELVLLAGDREVARVRIDKSQRVALNAPVAAGATRLRLRCVDTPTVAAMPNGDERTLLVMIRELSVHTDRALP